MAAARNDNFVYRGGNQRVPDGVRRARIHKSVKIVRARAFQNRYKLIYVEFHDGVEIIEDRAFKCCSRLQSIKMLGVKIIKQKAFSNCTRLTAVEFGDKLETIERQAFNDCTKLTDVEFGDKLETIEDRAFQNCKALKTIKMPSVRTVGSVAFGSCHGLSDVEFGEALGTLNEAAFTKCRNLKWITLPLKDNMIENRAFNNCPKLDTIDLVGGVHQTIASLHMESWRNEMNNEINRINQTLPTVEQRGKTEAIKQWMRSNFRRLHSMLLKEATTLLELALWKANLHDNNADEDRAVRTEGEVESSRDEIRYTSGADIVIKNVLPFLALK